MAHHTVYGALFCPWKTAPAMKETAGHQSTGAKVDSETTVLKQLQPNIIYQHKKQTQQRPLNKPVGKLKLLNTHQKQTVGSISHKLLPLVC